MPNLQRLNQTFRNYSCRAAIALRNYDENVVRHELLHSLEGNPQLTVGESLWNFETTVLDCSGSGQTFDLELGFTLVSGVSRSVSVGLTLIFDDWTGANYVFMPAAVYGSNNFEVMKVKYPPLWRDEGELRADMPVTMTDLPRLTNETTKIEQTTADVATPCMGFYAPKSGRGVLIYTQQQTRLGPTGMSVETKDGGHVAHFSLTVPCVRKQRQVLCHSTPSEDRAADWNAGDHVKMRVRLCFFPADDLQGLFDEFCQHRKALNPSNPACELPFSEAWNILEGKYNRENWDEHSGYYRMAPNVHTVVEVAENPLCFLWQLGWVGGGQATLPLIFQGSQLSRERAWRNLEMIFERTQAPSGFYYGIGDGRRFYGDGFDRPHPHQMHMVRKSSDWLYYSLKHFDLVEKMGQVIPAAWIEGIIKLADAFVVLWEGSGQFGQYVDVKSGKLLIGGSCAGGLAPAGLAMASKRFSSAAYLQIAQAAGRQYYDDFVSKGLTNGGPGDILSAPDSESAFSLMESFVKLFETDASRFWLKAARDTLRQAATWVVSYDYQFPPNSDLARSRAQTTGAVWANIQNKHGAPAICTLSGESLFRLWRATRDSLALELLHDIAHGIPQYLSREDRPLNGVMQPGWMCERVNLSDWEGSEGVGGKLYGSCWPEVSLMLTTMEIPGLYVQPDTGFFHVFDHIMATNSSHAGKALRLALENPTRFEAEIKVLCESSSDCHNPLGLNPLFATQRISIPAGRSVTFEFALQGGVTTCQT